MSWQFKKACFGRHRGSGAAGAHLGGQHGEELEPHAHRRVAARLAKAQGGPADRPAAPGGAHRGGDEGEAEPVQRGPAHGEALRGHGRQDAHHGAAHLRVQLGREGAPVLADLAVQQVDGKIPDLAPRTPVYRAAGLSAAFMAPRGVALRSTRLTQPHSNPIIPMLFQEYFTHAM